MNKQNNAADMFYYLVGKMKNSWTTAEIDDIHNAMVSMIRNKNNRQNGRFVEEVIAYYRFATDSSWLLATVFCGTFILISTIYMAYKFKKNELVSKFSSKHPGELAFLFVLYVFAFYVFVLGAYKMDKTIKVKKVAYDVFKR